MAYDRTIVVFSPDGRLLQVEYARQTVKRGSTAVGIVIKDGVVLGATKSSAPLAVKDSFKKISEVDSHIGVVSSGFLADARDLVEMARIKAQINRITYGEPISVKSLTKYIANHKHMVTQFAGVRPYGVGLLIGGLDTDGPKLYETDPSGTMIEWSAQSIGKGSEKAKKIMARGFREGMHTRDGVKLVVKALRAGERESEGEDLELVVITKNRFEKFSAKEAENYK